MTTVAQLIDWLKTQPQDAEVECGKESRSGYETYMLMDDIDLDCCTFYDFTESAVGTYTGRKIIELRAD
jgi:hypothetical protein